MYGALDCIFFPFLLYLSYIFFFFFFFSSRRRHTRCLSDWSSDVCSSDLITLTNGTWSGDVAALRADETNINRGNCNFYAWLQTAPAKNGTSDPFVVHPGDRKSTRLNSSHLGISYAVFCLKKKKQTSNTPT